jgi:DeoR family transcriptional regulator, suf operon transcriptional repressor
MMDAFGERQQELLKLLLRKKKGIGIDEISTELGITRPAIRQHLVALERLGYVEQGELQVTGGRPGQTYRLSQKGHDLFPKQYSWFSEVLLEDLHAKLGSKALGEMMERLGTEIGGQNSGDAKGETLAQKVVRASRLMNELAYEAETVLTGKELPGAPPVIEASNCVFHALATRFPEICQFDLALLSRLTGAEVIHEKCIVRGGGTCRFRFKARGKAST